ELLFDLRQRGGQRLGAFGVGLAGAFIHEGIPILSDKPQEPRPGGGAGSACGGVREIMALSYAEGKYRCGNSIPGKTMEPGAGGRRRAASPIVYPNDPAQPRVPK